jgi:hypothetical protein
MPGEAPGRHLVSRPGRAQAWEITIVWTKALVACCTTDGLEIANQLDLLKWL